MSPPELPGDIWAQIVSYLERPKPALRTKSWKDLHQHDLATMMQVSKGHFQVTAPFLYREPVVDNVWSFINCIELDWNDYQDNFDIDTASHSANIALPAKAKHLQYLPNFWPLVPPEFNELPDPQSGEPAYLQKTAKAFCFQHTKRLHIIHTEDSFNVKYFTIFYTNDRIVRNNLWMYAGTFVKSPYTDYRDRVGAEWAAELALLLNIQSNELIRLATGTRTYSFLRPQGLSFGAYGDRWWNQRQTVLEMRYETDIKLGSKYTRANAKRDKERFIGEMAILGVQNRLFWSSCYPKSHCNRFDGGPLGTINQPFLGWRPTYQPSTTVLHLDRHMTLQGITLGQKNIVIHHPIQSAILLLKIPQDRAVKSLVGLLKVLQDHSEGSAKSMMEADVGSPATKVEETSIDIYWYFQTGERAIKKDLKSMQAKIDTALCMWKGKVKVYAYSQAPECPSCGWRVGDDTQKK